MRFRPQCVLKQKAYTPFDILDNDDYNCHNIRRLDVYLTMPAVRSICNFVLCEFCPVSWQINDPQSTRIESL